MSLVTIKLLKTRHLAAFLLAIMMLVNCSPSSVESQQATATEKLAETQFVLNSPAAPISSPSVEPPIAEKTTLPPENILKFQPLEIVSELPPNIQPTDALVIGSEPLKLLHFEPQVHLETIPEVDPDANCLATSPDGKWLAYCPVSDDSPTGQWLIVQSADGNQQKKVPLGIYLWYLGSYGFPWLDNQHLAFLRIVPNEYPREGYPVVIINPFTGKQSELISNYPGFQRSPAGPAGHLDLGHSDVVYDPSLNLVIYPSAIGSSYLVLWDRQSKTVLAKVERAVGYYPLWSPDAKQFVVPLLPPREDENIVEEWFRIGRDGQVDQLTHFGDYFISAEMGSGYSWSPDGQKLAFWLDVSPGLCSGPNLAILDISTRQVIDTCILGNTLTPIWSLDSRYIVIENLNLKTQHTVLVDAQQGQAFDITDITESSLPIGWLVSP